MRFWNEITSYLFKSHAVAQLMQQAEKSRVRLQMVSLEVFIDTFLPMVYEVDSASNTNAYQEYFLKVKAADMSGS